jgi:hypothetical protein
MSSTPESLAEKIVAALEMRDFIVAKPLLAKASHLVLSELTVDGLPLASWAAGQSEMTRGCWSLIVGKVDFNLRNPLNDYTPLMDAAAHRNALAVRFLLTRGVHVNVLNKFGTHAFYIACSTDDDHVIKPFLEWAKVDGNGLTFHHLRGQKDMDFSPFYAPNERTKRKVRKSLGSGYEFPTGSNPPTGTCRQNFCTPLSGKQLTRSRIW